MHNLVAATMWDAMYSAMAASTVDAPKRDAAHSVRVVNIAHAMIIHTAQYDSSKSCKWSKSELEHNVQ